MLHAFSRTERLIGQEAVARLSDRRVAVFGIGGVGTYTVEGLARCGVGNFFLVDDDCICLTNINRQIHATHKTIGKSKVEVMKERILEINPQAKVEAIREFYCEETSNKLIKKDFDYIVDAIDTISGKIDLVLKARAFNIPIISAMGAGNKLDPTRFEISDIYKTSVCPLARVMRTELRKRNIPSLKVVYSKEEPIKPLEIEETSCRSNCVCPGGTTRKCSDKRQIPGSISFVPSVMGLIIAGEVIKDLLAQKRKKDENNV